MKKISKNIGIACLFMLASAFSKQSGNPPILWSKKKISWQDFKKQPDKDDQLSRNKALATIRLEQKYAVTAQNEIRFTIAAWFVPDKSWVKQELLPYSDNNFKSALERQQYHFNMAEVYARQIREALSKTVFYDSTYKTQIPDLFARYYKQFSMNEKKFQDESEENGVQAQRDWQASIDEALKKLTNFSDTSFVVRLK